jgi:hypothetical protein
VTILLGFVVIALATYQAQVVPQQNARVEFTHSQNVQGQLQDVRGAVVSVPGGGNGRSVSVDLGTRYPDRTIFVNPSPPSGQLRTATERNLTVDNATAAGEVGDFWDGTERNVSTRALEYRPDYNVYRNGPTTVIENTVVFDEQPRSGDVVVDSDQRLIDGNQIDLVAVQGDYRRGTSQTVAVDVRATSSSTRTVTLTEGDPVTVTVPTRLDATVWNESLLDGEENVVNVSQAGPNRVAIELAGNETYELQMAKVGLTNGVDRPGAAYLTDVEGDEASIGTNQSQRLVAEVRDEYNNPVSGVTTNVSFDDTQGDVEVVRNVSDADGRVVYNYEPDASAAGTTQTVTVSFSSSPGPERRVEFDISVGGSGNGSGSAVYDVFWNRSKLEKQSGVTQEASGIYRVNASVSSATPLTAETQPTVTGASLDYAVNNSTIGEFEPGDGTTNTAGNHTTVFEARVNGSVTAYVTGGGGGDSLVINVTDIPGIETVVFTDVNSDLFTVVNGSDRSSYSVGDAQVIGSTGTNVDGQDGNDVPFVDNNGNLKIVDETGGVTELASDAKSSSSLLAVGRWSGSATSVFYANSSDAGIWRAAPGSDPVQVDSLSGPATANAVLGIADIDSDAADELVFAGESPNGNSNYVNYIDDDGSVIEVSGFGANNNKGIGAPEDFNGDGRALIPIVDGSGNIQLLNSNGDSVKSFGSLDTAKKSPVGTRDIDGDGTSEVVYIGENGNVKYIDEVGGSNPTVKFVREADGSKVAADDNRGVA